MPPPRKVQYRPFTIEVTVGTKRVAALIDTGSTTSVISEDFEKQIPLSAKKEQTIDNLNLITACGDPMAKLKTVELKVKLHAVDDNLVRNNFHVVPNLAVSCILGMDFITNLEFRLNTASRRISYKNDGKQFHLIASISELQPCQVCAIMHQKLEDEIKKVIKKTEIRAEDLRKVLERNINIFATSDADFGKAIGVEHRIDTVGPPVYTPPRRQPRVMIPVIEDHIEMMRKNDVIEESTSPYSSAILLVKKKDGTIRFCIDFRFLNDITVKDKFPIPSIEAIKDYLRGAKFFSTLDFISGYWQIPIRKKDRHKTAFTTHNGHYQFKRMAFGLTNAPPSFQRIMTTILREAIGKFVLVYIDDVIIFSKTEDDHLRHIDETFALIRKSGMKLKLAKCCFFQLSVLYLGHIMSEEGSATDPKKIEVVRNCPRPENKKEVKSVNGFFGYYRKYIRNFAAIAHPLTKLTRNDIEFTWGPEQEAAFQTLKLKLTTAPILAHPDFTEEFIVYTDASGYGVGVVLGQIQWVKGKRREVVIAYGSKHLTESQSHWSTLQKELYAIIYALKIFHTYLYGPKFTVYTDQQALVRLLKKPLGVETAIVTRMVLQTQLYNMEVRYRPGKSNANADFLSRIPIPARQYLPSGVTTAPICLILENLTTEQGKDSYCKTAREKYERQLKKSAVKEEMCRRIQGNKERQRNSNGDTFNPHAYNWTLPLPAEETDSEEEEFTVLNNGLLATSYGKILAPESLREKILFRYHDDPLAGHLGTKKTIGRIRCRYYWPGMVKDIKAYVRQCAICEKRKALGASKAPLVPIPPPDKPWQLMAMDIVGPLDVTENGNTCILVMGEYSTRYMIAAPMKDQTADSVHNAFREKIILTHGVPEEVLTDQGKNFLSKTMDDFYSQLGVKRKRTTAYRPCCDGLVERFNRTLVDMMASYLSTSTNRWDDYLSHATFAYNTSVHAGTGYTPHYLMFGRDAREPGDVQPPVRNELITDQNLLFAKMWHLAKETARDRLMEAQEIQKRYYDKNVGPAKTYKKGEKVMLKVDEDIPGKFNMRWEGPYTVLEKKSNVNYKLLTPKGKEYVTHVDRMKKCKSEKHQEPRLLADATAAVAKAKDHVTASTNAVGGPNALATTTNNHQPEQADSSVTEKRVHATVTDPNTAVTESKTHASAANIKANVDTRKSTVTEATAKAAVSTTAVANAGAKVMASKEILNQTVSTPAATEGSAKDTDSNTAVSKARPEVAAPKRILTRKVTFPRKYKDFVVHTKKN